MLNEHSGSERGFTLIELIVGMVLGTIVLGMIVFALINLFDSGNRSAAQAKATRAAATTSDQLVNDLRAALAPERDPISLGSQETLRQIILGDYNPQYLLVHDILRAEPNELIFFADVSSRPNEDRKRPECVRWYQTQRGAVIREVYETQALPLMVADRTVARRRAVENACVRHQGTALRRTELMPAGSDSARQRLFTYTLLRQPVARQRVLERGAGRNCVGATASSIGDVRSGATWKLDQIVGVRIDAAAFVAGGQGRGAQLSRTAAAVPSRTSATYRSAIGCVLT